MRRRFALPGPAILAGLILTLAVTRATAGAAPESARALLHVTALFGGPLLVGAGVAAALYRAWQWPATLMLVLAGPAVVVVVAEAGSRLTGNYGFNGWEATIAANRTPRTWRGYPGARREFANLDHRNRWGFHDREPVAPGGRPRVLLIGDSQVEGSHVPIDSTTQGWLRRRCPDVDVVAIADAGWGAGDHLEALETWADSVRPDLVLIGHFDNDVPDASDEILRRRERARRVILPAVRFARRHRIQTAAIPLRAVSVRLHARALGDDRWGEPTTDVWRRAWRAHERSVARIGEWSDRHGVPVAWWGVPSRALQAGQAGASYIYERQERLVRRLGRDYIPLARRAAARPPGSPALHWPDDGHLNTAGHRYSARGLGEYLRGRGWPCLPDRDAAPGRPGQDR